jgi:hypothetical protein
MSNNIIELYVSSPACQTTRSMTIAQDMNKLNIECQVYNNVSSLVHSCNNGCVENGFYIKFINLQNKDFKALVWPYMQEKLSVKCAHVTSHDYKGCVMNWPTVFRESACYMNERENLSEVVGEVIDG